MTALSWALWASAVACLLVVTAIVALFVVAFKAVGGAQQELCEADEEEPQPVRANVVDAFRYRWPDNPFPTVLTPRQREDAAEEARYKRQLDGLGDQ